MIYTLFLWFYQVVIILAAKFVNIKAQKWLKGRSQLRKQLPNLPKNATLFHSLPIHVKNKTDFLKNIIVFNENLFHYFPYMLQHDRKFILELYNINPNIINTLPYYLKLEFLDRQNFINHVLKTKNHHSVFDMYEMAREISSYLYLHHSV